MCNSALPSRGFCGLLDVPTSCSSLFGRRHFLLPQLLFIQQPRAKRFRAVGFSILGSETSSTRTSRRAAIHQCFHDCSPLSSLNLTFKYRATAQRQTWEKFTSTFGYVHPRKKMTAENAMKITKCQTKLNAMRSERSNFHLRHIWIVATHASSSINSHTSKPRTQLRSCAARVLAPVRF
jgi:hypothetical protein